MAGYWERFTQTRISRRRALAGTASAGLGAVALAVIGCGGGDGTGTLDDPDAILHNWQRPDETRDAVAGGIHKSASTTDITGTLDPFTSPSFTTFSVAGVTYEPLLIANSGPGIDPRSSEGRRILGGLAESFEVSSDASEYTLKLRPNVRFHNIPPVSGRVMDIDDWRTSIERARSTSPLLRPLLNEQIDSVSFPDSRTMVIKLVSPNVAFLRALAEASASFYVLPKELNNDPRIAELNNIGTNYRALDRIQPSIGREYKQHPDYWRGKPFIDRWHVPIIPEYAQRYAQFVTGNMVDFTPRATDVLLLRNDAPNARIIRTEPPASYRTQYFGLREFETAPWRDERVRRAMRMAVDWDSLRAHFDNRTEFKEAGIEVESRTQTHVKAGGGGYPYWLDPKGRDFGPNAKYLLFNLSEARSLMSAAGYPNGIEIDGFMNAGTEYGSEYPEVVQITADLWNQSGLFRMRVNRIPYADFLPNYIRGKEFKGIIVQAPDFTYAEVDGELFNWFHSRGPRLKVPGLPGQPAIDPKVDEFVERQRVELDDNKRTQIIHDYQRYMAEKMWTVPGDGVTAGFAFQQPWYRNTAHAAYRHWIAADAPRRDQA
jgi:ABC-type transport system substrate-binding protein